MRHTNPGTTLFIFPLGQFYLDCNPEFPNGGLLSFTIITTEIYFGIVSSSVSANRLGLFVFLGSKGSHDIISSSSEGTLLARMRLATTANSFSGLLDLRWRNILPNPFTKVFALVDNISTDITTPGTHFINFTTAISNSQKEIPKEFSLSQNYPNPFNPKTIINYNIPFTHMGLRSLVQLKVYNTVGNEVATLVNEKQNSGSYEVTWDGNNNPSGVYFYNYLLKDLQI